MKKRVQRAARTARTPASQPLVARLRDRIAELEETLDAIRAGEVDALLVSSEDGERLFTLHGAETPYRVLVEQMSEGALTVDERGTIVYANRRFAEMLRVAPERVTGAALASFVIAEDVERLQQLLRSQQPAAGELTLTSGVSAYMSFSPLPDTADRCVLVTDLTLQKQAEFVAAAARKQRLTSIVNQVTSEHLDIPHLAAALMRAIGEHFGVSRCLLVRLDASGTRLTVESEYADRVSPAAARQALTPIVPQAFCDVLRAGIVIVIRDTETDARLTESRGALASLHLRSLVLVPRPSDGDGIVCLMLSHSSPCAWTTEELTLVEQASERVWAALDAAQSAEALRRRENRYRSLVDATTSIVWTGDASGAYVEPQPSWERFTGQPFDAHRGFGWIEAIHPDDRDGVWQAWKAARDAGAVYRSEGRLWHAASQSYRRFVARAAPVLDEGGGVSEWVGTCTDVAEQHAAAEALRIAQEELLESERIARTESERANRLKDDFLATMSHELRTPLNAILGWATVIAGPAQRGEDVARGLETILRNAKAQAQMIEELLDVSRITTGKVQLDVQRLDLAAIVEAAVESVRPAADAKGLRVQTLLDARARNVRGDGARLQQVVWNLLTNAVKFTPKGGRIQVVLERANSHAELSVSDTGRGIVPEFLPFVFDRFRQEDASTTRKHGGLGLGLAIVRTLVELHGGTVRVKSAGEDQGATFVVTLPLSLDRDEPAPLESSMVRGGANELVGDQVLSGVKVIFVDDDLDSRELMQRVLSEYGAEVWTAKSSAEARAIFAEVRPHVLVSDIGMPDQDGYDLIRAVRALPREQGGRTPAAAVTALARAEDRKRALLAGYQTHVAKPVDPAELVAVVASLAGRTGSTEHR